MQKFNILIAGCGDIGTTTAKLLTKNHRVYGLRRSAQALPGEIITIQADLSLPKSLSKALSNLPDIDIIIYCAAPAKGNQQDRIESYRQTYLEGASNLIAALKKPIKHIFFTSSTSVYHQNDHQWINENSTTKPQSETAKIMLSAEQKILSFAENSITNATIVRFSGIYSADRLHFFKRVIAGEFFNSQPPQYSNRIHVDDCAGILAHLIGKVACNNAIEPIYLASDNNPTPLNEVGRWLAQQTKATSFKEAPKRNTSSKRCKNSLILESGYRFIYPSFKEGYKEAVDNYLKDNAL